MKKQNDTKPESATQPDVAPAPKPLLTQQSLREQLQSAKAEAQSHYDNYQQALGIIKYCEHALSRFALPEKEVVEPKKLEEVQ